MPEIIYKELSYMLNGLFFKTHNELGRFRAEKTYADYFEELLISSAIEYKREERLSRQDIPDFIVENQIVVDFKAKLQITKEDYFQIKRYLSASKFKLGILVNFRQPHLYPKRIAN